MYKKTKHKKRGYIVEIKEQNPESIGVDKLSIVRKHVENNAEANKLKPKGKLWI